MIRPSVKSPPTPNRLVYPSPTTTMINRDAVRDINTVFPLERVRLLEQFGEIGKVNHRHFSFMGHISNRHLDTLINETAPDVAEKLKDDGVDIALLTPA